MQVLSLGLIFTLDFAVGEADHTHWGLTHSLGCSTVQTGASFDVGHRLAALEKVNLILRKQRVLAERIRDYKHMAEGKLWKRRSLMLQVIFSIHRQWMCYNTCFPSSVLFQSGCILWPAWWSQSSVVEDPRNLWDKKSCIGNKSCFF